MWCNPLLWCWLLNQHSKVVQWLQQKKRQKEKKKVPFRNVFFFFFFFTACCKDKDFTTQTKKKSRHLFKSRLGQSFSWSQFDIRASVMSWNRKEDSHPPLHESLSQTGDNDWIGPHLLHMSRRERERARKGKGGPPSHRGLRLQPHDELVALWVDELLPEPQEGERRHGDHQGEVQASQREDQTLTQGWGHRLLTH